MPRRAGSSRTRRACCGGASIKSFFLLARFKRQGTELIRLGIPSISSRGLHGFNWRNQDQGTRALSIAHRDHLLARPRSLVRSSSRPGLRRSLATFPAAGGRVRPTLGIDRQQISSACPLQQELVLVSFSAHVFDLLVAERGQYALLLTDCQIKYQPFLLPDD